MVKVIFFQPHPDDLELKCGHLIHYLATKSQKKNIIKIASITKGEFGLPGFKYDKFKGDFLAKIRTKELYAALSTHGINPKDIHFFGYIDGFVEFNREIIMKIVDYLKEERPDIIFAPEAIYTWYYHMDHINPSKAIFYIIYKKLIDFTPKLYFYGSLNPNYFFGFRRKDFVLIRNLLSCHKTQYWLINRLMRMYKFSTRLNGLKLREWKYAEKYRMVYFKKRNLKKNKPSFIIKILSHWFSCWPWFKAQYPEYILKELKKKKTIKKKSHI